MAWNLFWCQDLREGKVSVELTRPVQNAWRFRDNRERNWRVGSYSKNWSAIVSTAMDMLALTDILFQDCQGWGDPRQQCTKNHLDGSMLGRIINHGAMIATIANIASRQCLWEHTRLRSILKLSEFNVIKNDIHQIDYAVVVIGILHLTVF